MRDESAVRERPAVDGPAPDAVATETDELVDAFDGGGTSGVSER